MAAELDEIESYREKFIMTPGKYTDPYFDNPLNLPAYVKTGKIIDTGIIDMGVPPNHYYSFRCATSVIILDCVGRSLGANVMDGSKGGPIYAIIAALYDDYRAAIYELNPCPESYIDLRTIEQYSRHCCPKALEAAMLEGGYE